MVELNAKIRLDNAKMEGFADRCIITSPPPQNPLVIDITRGKQKIQKMSCTVMGHGAKLDGDWAWG